MRRPDALWTVIGLITIGLATYEQSAILASAVKKLLSLRYPDDIEIVIVAGGRDETLKVAKKLAQTHQEVRVITESERKGKPWALNQILSTARGEIVLLTDADAVIENEAIPRLLAPLIDQRTGATCARVIALNDRSTFYGFWAHYLCEAAHQLRTTAHNERRFYHLTGYLYAVKKKIIKNIPEDSLAEDAAIGLMIRRMAYEIEYVPEAKVFVKFPENMRDIIDQKVRTRAGFVQLPLKLCELKALFQDELCSGLLIGVRFSSSFKELLYFLLLSALWRFVWVRAFWELKLRRRTLVQIWRPIGV